jgi:hypothetical protein
MAEKHVEGLLTCLAHKFFSVPESVFKPDNWAKMHPASPRATHWCLLPRSTLRADWM